MASDVRSTAPPFTRAAPQALSGSPWCPERSQGLRKPSPTLQDRQTVDAENLGYAAQT